MLKYIFFLFFSFSLFSFAQKETYNWYFGYGAGITFMPGGDTAKFLPGGEFERNNMWLNEGVATLSDRNGNLLLYSDGNTVWNKHHKPIKNGIGLHGGKGSARSVIIIPKPASNQYYYVFTIEAHEDRLIGTENYYRYGLRYSIVDIFGDNGNGEIAAEQKNLPFLSNVVEKMITINHANQNDVWLVVYNWTDNNFYVYLITKDKIELSRTIKRPYTMQSEERFLLTSNNLEYDINSKRLIDCDAGKGFVIYDFNSTFGTIDVDNAVILPASPPNWDPTGTGKRYFPYSGAFSEDGTKFYGTCYDNALLQYDFSYNDVDSIIASRTVIADEDIAGINNTNFGALRLGPDGKIYVACDTSSYLGAIENPNLSSEQCNYNSKKIYLEGTQSGYGLPIMMNYTGAPCVFAGAAGNDKHTCAGTEIELGNTTFDNGAMSFEWNPKTGLDNPYIINPKCTPTETVQYVLTITDNINACSDNDTILITVNNSPNFMKAEDETVCKAQAVTLGEATNSDAYVYEWVPADYLSDAHSKTPLCTPEATTSYILSILDTATGCYSYDTIEVNVTAIDDFEVAGSFFICTEKSTTLSVVEDFASYAWSTGETTKSITVSEPCTLEVSVTTANGCTGKRTIIVQTLDSDNFSIIAPASICAGIPAELSVNMEFASYVWSTGETTPTTTITEAGIYWVIVENEYSCTASDTITITESQIDYSLALANITFANLCAGISSIANQFTNNGNNDIVIDTMFILDNELAFKTDIFTFPISIKSQSNLSWTTFFNGTEAGIYTDTLVISISEPCSAKILIPLYANSGGARFVINAQARKVEPGKSLAIPISIENAEEAAINEEFVFTIKCDVRWDMLEVTGISGGVIKERAKDASTLTETLLIEATYPANTSSIGIELLANAYVGRDIISQIKFYNFDTKLSCLLADSAVSTVELIGCNIPIRIFDFFNATEMAVESQYNTIACKIKTEERGEFILELFDLTGNLVKKHIWSKETSILEEQSIVLEVDLPAGNYFIMLKSPSNYLTNRVVIVR